MSKAFGKFINPKPVGAKKKENLKQEKRAIKKEREEFFINKKRVERAAKKEAFERRDIYQQLKAEKAGPKVANERTAADTESTSKRTRVYKEKDKPSEVASSGRKSYFKSKETIQSEKEQERNEKLQAKTPAKFADKKALPPKGQKSSKTTTTTTAKPRMAREKLDLSRPALNSQVVIKNDKEYAPMPLNKYVAHCGICARREAVSVIKLGKIKVNNKVLIDPAYRVQQNDIVKFDTKVITPQNNLVYILLNKPKDFLTTADDPSGRKTVMDLVANATPERVYPVGRLDRNTTGVLLLTNDGELAQKLTHPKNEIKKIYEVKLDRPLTKTDAEKILGGLQLEDGLVTPDALAYADTHDKSIIGVEIHSGKNRIVRRIFEHLQYEVRGLDRVLFAGLTKKNVERGRYRFLAEKEVRNLKFLNASKAKKNS